MFGLAAFGRNLGIPAARRVAHSLRPADQTRLPSSQVTADMVSPSLQALLFLAAERAATELARSERTPASEIRAQLSRLVRLGLSASDSDTNGVRVGDTQEFPNAIPRHYADVFRSTFLGVV